MITPKLQRVLVFGLAASGQAAARLLAAEGFDVLVLDQADSEPIRSIAHDLEKSGVRVRLGCKMPPHEAWSLAVISPGVSVDAPEVRELIKLGVPIVSELELGWSRMKKCRTLAITGSNGKSTLAALCAATLRMVGHKSEACGNFGPPVSMLALNRQDLDWAVMEVSSFQFETVSVFKPDVGVLLNVFPNHLDRHGCFDVYQTLKMRMFARMQAQDLAVLPEILPPHAQTMMPNKCRIVSFGSGQSTDYRYVSGRVIASSGENKHRILDLAGTYFNNEVLGLAAAAAWAAIDAAGVPTDALLQAMREFQPLPHRLREVAAARGVRFVDDSKATNLAAMMAALRMTPAPVRLVAGGLPKNEPLTPALSLLRERVAGVYLIGTAAENMADAWHDAVDCKRFLSLADAVNAAWLDAKEGDTVLLAPACASFDQFQNFEDRGIQFSELARQIAATCAS